MSTEMAHSDELARRARRLRQLHVPGRPLVLPNAWDAASARGVERAGFPAVATASAAVSASLGYPDGEGTPPDEMFAAIRRIASAVEVPVTADVEAGYGLAPDDLVEMLLAAGAVGCNLEDSDHVHGGLVDEETQSGRLEAVREAAERAGVPLVINARVDVYLQDADAPPEAAAQEAEALRRGTRYLRAGADCVYPIMLTDEGAIGRLARQLDGRVNVFAGPAAPPLPRLTSLGVARISFGPWVQRLAMREADAVLAEIAAGVDPYASRRDRESD